MGSFGVENLKKIFKLVIDFSNVADKMGHEKEWAARAGHLFQLLPTLMGLPAVEWSKLGSEIKEMSVEERAEIIAYFRTELNLKDDELESAIEDCISIINDITSLVITAIKLANRK